MPISETSAAESIARVLAARHLSANAGGIFPSAAPDVEDSWREYISDAAGILRTLREPDIPMANVGALHVWVSMIDAAIAVAERLEKD